MIVAETDIFAEVNDRGDITKPSEVMSAADLEQVKDALVDAKGNPVHYSPYNGEVLPGYMYTDTGFWDTFRSLFPLLNLVYPSVNAEIQAGLANAYRESGFLPEWASPGHRGCMVGNNSASVVSDAILKGVTPEEDIATLYEAMLAGRRKVHPTLAAHQSACNLKKWVANKLDQTSQ